jgi:hypothetical protein
MRCRKDRRTIFDKKTHKRRQMQTQRYHTFSMHRSLSMKIQPDDVPISTRAFGKKAQTNLNRTWVLLNGVRLANSSISEMDPLTQKGISHRNWRRNIFAKYLNASQHIGTKI